MKYIMCFMLGLLGGIGLMGFIKNSRIAELEYINNQLRLEYDELKVNCGEIGFELHSCYYALDETEEYCFEN